MASRHSGDPVHVALTKWGERPHWEFDARYLGCDEHGEWIGIPTGTPMARPGAAFIPETDQVSLVPRPDAGGGAGWLATFNAPGYLAHTYVDMTTVPRWLDVHGALGPTVSAVDLDLDVIRAATGDVWVDDEDEFDDHRLRHAYPPDVVALARTSCAWVLEEVLAERPPFDGDSAAQWLSVLRAGATDDVDG